MIYMAGPGRGAPRVLRPVYLKGTYSEVCGGISSDTEGLLKLFRQFSFPGGIGSHCTPETFGSIHEGGELGYSLSHGFGAVFDNPELIAVVMVGDGEAETGPLAIAWHSTKFLNPSWDDVENLFVGFGYRLYFVEGSDPASMHQAMAATLDRWVRDIRKIRQEARSGRPAILPRYPMVVLRTPKGWTAPDEVDGHTIEGSRRAHQVPLPGIQQNPEHLRILETWLRSYHPETAFDAQGRLVPELRALSPQGRRRMGANPHANGGLLRRDLVLPDFRSYGVAFPKPGTVEVENTRPLGVFLQVVYEASKKFWIAERFPEDADGCDLSSDGRITEMLREHTPDIDSMFNQHAKSLEICNRIARRADVSSLNWLITSTVWRQDHNGFTHQDPGFLDLALNKSPDVVRICVPPEVKSLLSVADHWLRSKNYVNIVVSDKQNHLQFLSVEEAVIHCTKGLGIGDWASNDQGVEPDVVLAAAGAVPTVEALAVNILLRDEFPDLKVRFIREFDTLFTSDKPVIFNFHAYPWMIHRMTYRRTSHPNIPVRGYKEKGSINIPLKLAVLNQIDRFSIAMDVIDRVPRLKTIGAHSRERLRNEQMSCLNYAREFGVDRPDTENWKWPW